MNFITLIGFFAGICSTSAFVPQAIKTIRTKSAKDLSFETYLLINLGLLLWLIYGILLKELPIILANGIAFVFAIIILFLIIKYKKV
ncbi:MAG: SemiSWEET family sugar transporter [Candidatus Woesearchaeota archaeon]